MTFLGGNFPSEHCLQSLPTEACCAVASWSPIKPWGPLPAPEQLPRHFHLSLLEGGACLPPSSLRKPALFHPIPLLLWTPSSLLFLKASRRVFFFFFKDVMRFGQTGGGKQNKLPTILLFLCRGAGRGL